MRNVERHQNLERSQIQLRDNHDREWLVESEVGLDSTRRPVIVTVGQFHPNFVTPYNFLPPPKYLTYTPRNPGKLTIEYGAWETDVKASHAEVKSYLSRLALAIYKTEAAKYVAEPSDEMLEVVYGSGKGPEPWEPIAAARQGNGWILGLRPFDPTIPGDVTLKKYLDQWVAVRYHEVKTGDQPDLEALDFTEGQKKKKVAV